MGVCMQNHGVDCEPINPVAAQKGEEILGKKAWATALEMDKSEKEM